jgi:hypothetical protein
MSDTRVLKTVNLVDDTITENESGNKGVILAILLFLLAYAFIMMAENKNKEPKNLPDEND